MRVSRRVIDRFVSCILASFLGALLATPSIAQLATSHPSYAALKANVSRAQGEIDALVSQGKYREALKVVRRALAIERELYGEGDQQVYNSLHWIAATLAYLNEWDDASDAWTEVLAWREKYTGRDHWQTTDARLDLNYARRRAAQPDELAARLAEADALSQEAVELDTAGKPREAVERFQAAVAIRRAILGDDGYKYGKDLAALGLLLKVAGDVDEAVLALNKALPLLMAACGESHPEYARALSQLAETYFIRGEYQRAVPLFEEALDIVESTEGMSSTAYAKNLNGLALAHAALGEHAVAAMVFRQVVERARETADADPINYATALGNLAGVYSVMGDYSRAEELYQESLELCERAYGTQRAEYAHSLNALGQLYGRMHRLDDAKSYLERALAIRRAAVGDKHLDTAATLNNLAVVYRMLGNYDKAAELYAESLEIKKLAGGEMNPLYGGTLLNLAIVEAHRGNIDRAEALCDQSLVIFKNTLPPFHPEYARALTFRASLYERRRNSAAALPLYREAFEIVLKQFNDAASAQSEQQQLLAARAVRSHLDEYLSCTYRVGSGKHVLDVYRAAVAWKGATFVRQRAMRLAAASPELRPLLAELQSVVHQWIRLSEQATQSHEPLNLKIAALSARREELEIDLSAKSKELQSAFAQVTLEDIVAALPPDGALIDFMEFAYIDPINDAPDRPSSGLAAAAFVLRADGTLDARFQGNVPETSRLIELWRSTYGEGAEGEEAAREIRARVWIPLEELLVGARTVLISPDGALGRLPFAALPGKEPGTYLLEEYRFTFVPAPRTIPAWRNEVSTSSRPDHELLLVGDVDYGPTLGRWLPLPGAAQEMRSVADLFRALRKLDEADIVQLEGAGATKTRFRTAASASRIIHLATHGFFTGIDQLASDDYVLNETQLENGAQRASKTDVTHHVDEALLRSGLVFAGANMPIPDLQSTPDPNVADAERVADSGILTAAELALLSLGDVDLVVLSACDTGLGPAANGEGLLGIQRACQIAGARNTVASLWKVDDQMTQRLMVEFYHNLLEKKQSYLDALRNAQLTLLNELRGESPASLLGSLPNAGPADAPTTLADRGANAPADAANGAASSPRVWAAFTFSGDWR
jgi:CHAT domain-containing protein/tetratricopeptide (TPR) repeat protein